MRDGLDDIFTEPDDVDPNTLANLGPLTPMAGIWEGAGDQDVHPVSDGGARSDYVERYELQPIDPQLNGPQLLYGLRYHVHITKTDRVATFHDQVGYWLWEPATGSVIHTLAIPRGLVAIAAGRVDANARTFELHSVAGAPHYGICANPFLDAAFHTLEFRVRVTIHDDGTWLYEQYTVLRIKGCDEPFHHTDRNTLRKIAAPTPNPSATLDRPN